MTSTLVETAAQRLAGERASRPRALIASTVVALSAGTIAYKLLRSGGAAEDESSEASGQNDDSAR